MASPDQSPIQRSSADYQLDPTTAAMIAESNARRSMGVHPTQTDMLRDERDDDKSYARPSVPVTTEEVAARAAQSGKRVADKVIGMPEDVREAFSNAKDRAPKLPPTLLDEVIELRKGH